MDKINISTQTFTITSNIGNINLLNFYNNINIFSIDNLSLTYIRFKNMEKGMNMNIKKKNRNINFLNCITFIFYTNNKKVNIKMFRNGVFQITGCKMINSLYPCLTYILSDKFIKDINIFKIQIKSVMKNINFNIGFNIDRDNVIKHLNKKYNNILVHEYIYNKMEIKLKIKISDIVLENIPVYFIEIKDSKIIKNNIVLNKSFYNNNKNRYVTISIFRNGNVLLSAIDDTTYILYFKYFMHIINKFENKIKYVNENQTTDSFISLL